MDTDFCQSTRYKAVMSQFKVGQVMNRTLEFWSVAAKLQPADDALNYLFDLMYQRSTKERDDRFIMEFKAHLEWLRVKHQVVSRFDKFITDIEKLKAESSNNEVASFFETGIALFKKEKIKYHQVINDLLERDNFFKNKELVKDLEDYKILVRYSTVLGNTIIIDEWGIYPILERKIRLTEPTYVYADIFRTRAVEIQREMELIARFYFYLSDALDYISKT